MSSRNTWATVEFATLVLLLIGVLLVAATGEAGVLDAAWTAPTTNTDGSPLTDLSGYLLYYGTAASPCPGSAFVQIASPTSAPSTNQTVSTRLTGLTAGTLYFVSVSAVDTSGTQSPCSATASAAARSGFGVSPTGTVNFGSINVGSFADRTFTVSNTGGGTISGSASVSPPFSVVSGSPFTLSGAGTSQTVTARFTPSTTATASATISFTANGSTASAIVTGSGTGLDTTAPVVTITSPTSAPTYSTTGSSMALQGTASDNVGVTQVTWSNDRGGSGTAAGTTAWNVSGIVLQSGTNMLTVTARDAAGNTGKATIAATVTVASDTTPPTVSITTPGSGAIVSGTTTVTASASDNVGVAGVQFLLDGAAYGSEKTTAPFSISWTTGGVSNGAHTLSARARDAAGNTALAANIAVTVSNTVAVPSSSPSTLPRPELVAAYSFNEGSGAAVADASGNNNTGTLGTGVTWTGQGRFGSALVFNGAGFVTIPAAASLNLTTAMTLEAWVYPTATASTWSTVLMKEQPGEFVYTLYAGARPNRPHVFFNTGTSAKSERTTIGAQALLVNTWSHLAGTYDGATLKLYVNGVLVASNPFTGPILTSTGALRIGGNGIWKEFFQGRIDEVRIYSRALSSTEVQADMNTAVGSATLVDVTPPTVSTASVPVTVSNGASLPSTQPQGLVAAYSFSEGTGTVVRDASGNNNTGTLGSGVSWTRYGRFGSAIAFNGTDFVTIPATSSLNLTAGMTLEAWVYPTSTTATWSTVLMKEQPGEFVYTLYAGSPVNQLNVYFNVGTASSGEHGTPGPAALPLNTWSHLAGTYDGANLRLYVNGVLVSSQPFSGPIAASAGALRLGGNGVWGEYFKGVLDEIRIYARPLSIAEIQADMNAAIGN